MATNPQTGLGDALYVGDNTTYLNSFDLSGDIGSLSKVTTSLKPLEVTGINKSGIERLPGQRDGEIAFSAWFNPGVNQEHATFKLRPTNDVQVGYFRGTVLGNSGAAMLAKQITYNPKRGTDGSLTFDVQAQANAFGLEWGRQLTAGVRTDSAATTGTGVQSATAGSTGFGFQAYLWVFGVTGTSATFVLQDSPDNVTYSTLTGGSFGAFTAGGVGRLAQGAGTVNQWTRVNTTGTFSNAQFAVLFMRNLSTMTF